MNTKVYKDSSTILRFFLKMLDGSYDGQVNTTVKAPKRDHIGGQMFGPCREVGPISEVFLQIYFMSL